MTSTQYGGTFPYSFWWWMCAVIVGETICLINWILIDFRICITIIAVVCELIFAQFWFRNRMEIWFPFLLLYWYFYFRMFLFWANFCNYGVSRPFHDCLIWVLFNFCTLHSQFLQRWVHRNSNIYFGLLIANWCQSSR